MQTPTPRIAPAFNLADLFMLRVKPVTPPARGRAARALHELDSLGVDFLSPEWSDMADSSLGFGPAARDVNRFDGVAA